MKEEGGKKTNTSVHEQRKLDEMEEVFGRLLDFLSHHEAANEKRMEMANCSQTHFHALLDFNLNGNSSLVSLFSFMTLR